MQAIKIGDKVKVTTRYKQPVGTVLSISTWKVLLGELYEDAPCYYIECPDWKYASWISQEGVVLIGEEA